MKARKNRKIIIILNSLVIITLTIELYFPFNQSIAEKFHEINYNVTNVPSYKGSGGYEVNNYLQCKSGNVYKLGIVPVSLSSIQENEEIIIFKTPIFLKTKAIKSDSKTVKVLFLLNNLIICIIGFALILTIANVFFPNGILDFILSFASIFLYFLFVAYLVYY